ncbi:MAG: hypothetical protein WA975_03275 [Mesorhizobium sp.]
MARLIAKINCGDGAFMSIVDPRSFADGGVAWKLRYGFPEAVRFVAASLIKSYDYLLFDEINMKEATRRLRLLLSGRAALEQEERGE